MKYGNISEVMIFKTREAYVKAMKVLTDSGNSFETSGHPFCLNFYPDHQHGFPHAQIHLGLAGMNEGEAYEVKYR